MIEDVEKLVAASVTEVFKTMLDLQAQLEPAGTAITNSGPQVAGSVGFIGHMTGVVYLYSTQTFARRMTSAMLGLADHEIEGNEMVNDVIGELSNMVVGQIKFQRSDRGTPCMLTIPSIVRGSHLTVEPLRNTEKRVFSFRFGPDQLVVELLLKPGNGAA